MPTYNHSRYLEEAVLGVMSQIIDVPLILIIRDDASDDGTTEIARRLARRFKGRIKLIINKKNDFYKPPGPAGVMLTSISRIQRWLRRVDKLFPGTVKRETFVALCEGDDFWVDSSKLQIQLDHMRNNSDLALVHHDVSIKVEPGGLEDYEEKLLTYLGNFQGSSIEEFGSYFRFAHNVMTCSVLFRLSALDLEMFLRKPAGVLDDWVLFSILARNSVPLFIPKKMATYRVQPTSVWSSKSDSEKIPIISNTSKFLEDIFGKI